MSFERRASKFAADYIVVGAGSAGCVVAARLSETGASVLMLEAGPSDWHPLIHIPAGVIKLLKDASRNWIYPTTPEASISNRQFNWPRGKVLGGTSSINGLAHVRGNPADYNHWAQMGCRGWSYEEILPFFRKSESFMSGDADIRGKDGPLVVDYYTANLPLTRFFVEAAQQAGFRFVPDYNGREQEGVGYGQQTRNGRFRCSTASAFLQGAKRRDNLRVVTHAQATRLLFDGTRCIGVAFRDREKQQLAVAGREVILSAGSMNSPHLLQISGVGSAEHLRSIGVDVVLDAPEVGRNLIDHFGVRISHRVKDQLSVNQLAQGPRLALEVAKYVLAGKGALTFGVSTAHLFCKSQPHLASPDLQLSFQPASYDPSRFGEFEKQPGMTIAVIPARPESRGTLMAKSPDPFELPEIRPGYLTAKSDLDLMVAGIRVVRRIFEQPALATRSLGEVTPTEAAASDEELAQFCRQFGTHFFHQIGTCRMGEDPAAVVDSRLRVRGLDGLRVVDGSIMPTMTTGNTNAPIVMIAEKAAAMILQDARP